MNMEKVERLPRRYTPGPADVFALVKQDLPDEELLQKPLLIFPNDAAHGLRDFWRSAAVHKGIRTNVDPERSAALNELADALNAYPQYGRAVQYMRSLAGAAPYERVDAHPITFLREAGAPRPSLVVSNLPTRPERPRAHELHVRFHRPR